LEVHQVLNLIYILIKIRGADKVKSFFPHEARDFEPVILYLLSVQNGVNSSAQPWESNYVMLIWLSLILLMPFDLKILDSDISKHFLKSDLTKESSGIVKVIISICQKFLDSSTRTTSAASVCLGRLFTRSDVKKMNTIVEYIDWVENEIAEKKHNPSSSFFIAGLYNSLYSIFRILNREEVSPIQDKVFKLLFGENLGQVGKSETQATEMIEVESLESVAGVSEKTTTVRHFKTKVA